MAFRTLFPEQLDPVQTGALLTGGVGPRPIALASTRSPDGVRNLAPFSFFNAFGSNPPMVAFAPNRRGRDGTVKHTYQNVVATDEFVIAAVSYAMVQQMNVASAEYPEGVDEFVKAGFGSLPALRVKPDLVAESPFQMECRLRQVVELATGPGSGSLLVGEVLAFHAREDCFDGAALDPGRLDLVGRNGGSWYTRASGAALFELPKPKGRPVGYDALPGPLRASRILTGNDLGRLAHSAALPDLDQAGRRPGDPEDAEGLERAIQRALAEEDLAEAWRLVGVRLRVRLT
jgi:flavin reductase (DIM6/NTAB) family NADH-FMN oxidoreductase RutF